MSAHVPTLARLSTPWPASASWDTQSLTLGGVAAASLADAYGTPLLLIDEEHLRACCRRFRQAFPRVLYAVKALTARRLLQIVAAEGLGLLAASEGELAASLRAGIAPCRIALHGNNKSDGELEAAIAAGIGLLICDHRDEIERAAAIALRLGRRQDVLLRIIPALAAGDHRFLATGTIASKFGLPLQTGDARRAVERVLASESLRFCGLHLHLGSQILTAGPYLRAIDILAGFAGKLHHHLGAVCEIFDLGGGFGITYVDEAAPEVQSLAGAVKERLAAACARHRISQPELIVEPGRAIIGNAGLTLYRIGAIKQGSQGLRFVAVDGGMSDNLRPMLYGARYSVAPVVCAAGDGRLPATVVGKHCESGDVIAQVAELPRTLAVGDMLAVAATGAYCYSMASNYNRTPRPAVVAVRHGQPRQWLRRETLEDLDHLEMTAASPA